MRIRIGPIGFGRRTLRSRGTGRPLSPRAARAMRGVLAVLAVGLQAGGVFALWRTERWIASSATVEGTVVSVERSRGRRGRSTYRETVRFVAADGTEHEFTESVGTSDPYATGDVVAVRYQPSDPSDASIDTAVRLWLVPGLLLVVGVGCAAGAFLVRPGVVSGTTEDAAGEDAIGEDAIGDVEEKDTMAVPPGTRS